MIQNLYSLLYHMFYTNLTIKQIVKYFSAQYILSNLLNVLENVFLTSVNPPPVFITLPPFHKLSFISTSAIQPFKSNRVYFYLLFVPSVCIKTSINMCSTLLLVNFNFLVLFPSICLSYLNDDITKTWIEWSLSSTIRNNFFRFNIH